LLGKPALGLILENCFLHLVNRMDTFEQAMDAMSKMDKDEQSKKIGSMKDMCICPKCPSYTSCAKNAKELLFCATGKSFMCIDQEKGCICPGCPVTKQLGLKNKFFCTKGSEKAQRYEHTIWGASLVR